MLAWSHRAAATLPTSAVVLFALALTACGATAATKPVTTKAVPVGFIGMTTSPPLLAPGFPLTRELGIMRRSGVESLRLPLNWASMQPYRRAADVPGDMIYAVTDVGGVPTDFGESDRQVAAAASAGLTVLPFVIGVPRWAGGRPAPDTPAAVKAYAAFMRGLVARYGPKGTFWRERPQLRKLPIRDWQVWNEPHLNVWWPRQPYAAAYVRLLRAARTAIKRADPSARVILCGLSNRSWQELAKIYRAGGRGLFDAIAIHPYTLEPANVLEIARRARATSRTYRDGRRPILITEFGWPAATGKIRGVRFGFETTTGGQLARIREALRLLAANRVSLGIQRVYWETWLTEYRSRSLPFDYTGLRKLLPSGAVRNTPAFGVFRRTARGLEACVSRPASPRCR